MLTPVTGSAIAAALGRYSILSTPDCRLPLISHRCRSSPLLRGLASHIRVRIRSFQSLHLALQRRRVSVIPLAPFISICPVRIRHRTFFSPLLRMRAFKWRWRYMSLAAAHAACAGSFWLQGTDHCCGTGVCITVGRAGRGE